MNIAGSYNPLDQCGGADGVFRDHTGNWVIGFTSNFFCTSSNQVETFALKYATEIALSHNIQQLHIQTDSQVLVQAINEGIEAPNLTTMIYDCILLLRAMEE